MSSHQRKIFAATVLGSSQDKWLFFMKKARIPRSVKGVTFFTPPRFFQGCVGKQRRYLLWLPDAPVWYLEEQAQAEAGQGVADREMWSAFMMNSKTGESSYWLRGRKGVLKWRNFALLWGIWWSANAGENEVMKAALVSIMQSGGFSICAGVDWKSLSKINLTRFICMGDPKATLDLKRALIHTLTLIFHEHKVSLPWQKQTS